MAPVNGGAGKGIDGICSRLCMCAHVYMGAHTFFQGSTQHSSRSALSKASVDLEVSAHEEAYRTVLLKF